MLNRVVLMGRLVADPELRNTQNGTSVVQFRLAVERDYTPKGQEKQTDFIDIVAWRNTAEFIVKYFEKGQLIALTGTIQTRSYTDRQGNKRIVTEVIADQVYFCGGKNDNKKEKPSFDENEFEEIDTSDGPLPF